MTRILLTSFAFVLFVASPGLTAPRREPSGMSGGAIEIPAIPLDKLAKDGVIAFGDWVVGQTSHENGILLVHKQTRMGIYLPWASNGWINYRSADGTGHVHWSQGGSAPQQRDYELDRLFAKPTQQRVAPGRYDFQTWNVTVTDDTMVLNCTNMGCRLTIRRDVPAFTHNARTVGVGQ
jgi:hypothetical protein